MNGTDRSRLAEVAAVSRPTRRWLSRDEIRSIPPIEWMVEGIIPKTANVVLFGPSGHGKSFIVQDMALSIVQEETWQGIPIQGGPVACIVAEDAAGFNERMQAWEQLHGGDAHHQLQMLPEAVNFMNPKEVDLLLDELRAMPELPVLIFIDTLARCLVGGDENSAKDMGIFNAACERIRKEIGATVLTVHHSDKNGSRYRGSSALRAAADTMIEVTMTDDVIKMHSDKTKNRKAFADMTFALIPVGDSCILGQPGVASGKFTKAERQMLEALSAGTKGLRRGKLGEAAGVKGGSLDRALTRLTDAGCIAAEGQERTARRVYRMTERGQEMLAGVGGVTAAIETKSDPLGTSLHHCPTTVPNRSGGAIRHEKGPVHHLHHQSTTSTGPGEGLAQNSTTTPPPRRGGGGVECGQVRVLEGGEDNGTSPSTGPEGVVHAGGMEGSPSHTNKPSREQRLAAHFHTSAESWWHEVLEVLKQGKAVTTVALLNEVAAPLIVGDEAVLQFDYAVLADKFRRGNDPERVSRAIKEVTGLEMRVGVAVTTGPPAARA